MAGVNINVSVDELNRFAEYVANFDKGIEGDCAELKISLSKLAAMMDEASISEIRSMVGDISRILEEEGPTLKRLQDKVLNYADFVAKLRSIVTSK